MDASNPHNEFSLFATNLSKSVDEGTLVKVFGEKYKSCCGAKINRYSDGTSKESGFIRFSSETDQQMALVEMHKTRVKGREITLKLAHPKQNREGGRRGRGSGANSVAMPGFNYAPVGMMNEFGMPMQQYPMNPMMPSNIQPLFMPRFPMPQYGAYNMNYSNGRESRGGGRRGRNRSRSRSPNHLLTEPLKQYIEPVDPPSSVEHNDFVMDAEWDWQLALDSARFSKLLIPYDLKSRDLAVKLYEV